mmetsp:Transcript_160317/g.282896  ORF Transcript_160317/g.282896 Transcript_160317/m.282896 type:complete len:161 (-) Transcript_160317:248-730(-)
MASSIGERMLPREFRLLPIPCGTGRCRPGIQAIALEYSFGFSNAATLRTSGGLEECGAPKPQKSCSSASSGVVANRGGAEAEVRLRDPVAKKQCCCCHDGGGGGCRGKGGDSVMQVFEDQPGGGEAGKSSSGGGGPSARGLAKPCTAGATSISVVLLLQS